MSTEQNKVIAREFIQLWGNGSLDIIDKFADPSFSGIHKGTFLGYSATNKRVKWTGMTIYRIVDGKVMEERGEEDHFGFLRQIDVIAQS